MSNNSKQKTTTCISTSSNETARSPNFPNTFYCANKNKISI
jgi:hypothetical protein